MSSTIDERPNKKIKLENVNSIDEITNELVLLMKWSDRDKLISNLNRY